MGTIVKQWDTGTGHATIEYGGQTSSCTITQAAGDPTLSVSPASLSLGWESNSTATATVTSNTSWEVV